jgi:predicted dinucleotide-binding enzyme
MDVVPVGVHQGDTASRPGLIRRYPVPSERAEGFFDPKGARDRIALGAAGDDRLAVRKVMRLLDQLGFDSVDAGPLNNGIALEPDGSPIATTYNADELSKLLAR